METTVIVNWKEHVTFSSGRPLPQILAEDDKVKVLVAGLEPGGNIPVHPEGAAVYYILEGTGWMVVDDQRFEVQPGMIILTPDGAARGLEPLTRLAFLATRIA